MYAKTEDGVLGTGLGEALGTRVGLACSESPWMDAVPAFGFDGLVVSIVPVRGRESSLEFRVSSAADARARSLVVKNFERSSARVAALAVWAGVLLVSGVRALTATKPEEGDIEARVPLMEWGE